MYKVIVRFKSPFNGVIRNLSVFSSPFSNTASSTPPPTQEEVESQEPNELQVKIDGLTKKVEEIDDKYKRALAETENMRLRMMKQIEEAKIFGIQGFCKDLLEVADVLQVALKSVPRDQVKDEHFKSLLKGVEMMEQNLQTVFRRHGLNQINPIGAKFDPNEHHAMFEAVDESKEPGTVAVVTQIGYKLHGRTIRPAMVGVVKSTEKKDD